jgi:hypothetical protein
MFTGVYSPYKYGIYDPWYLYIPKTFFVSNFILEVPM